jgi:hypothetical protein
MQITEAYSDNGAGIVGSFCWRRKDTSPSHCECLSDYLQLP